MFWEEFCRKAMMPKASVVGGNMDFRHADILEIPWQGAKFRGCATAEHNDTFRRRGYAQDLPGEKIQGGNPHAAANQADCRPVLESKTAAKRSVQVQVLTGRHCGEQPGPLADNLIEELRGRERCSLQPLAAPDVHRLPVACNFRRFHGEAEYFRGELFLPDNFGLFFKLIHAHSELFYFTGIFFPASLPGVLYRVFRQGLLGNYLKVKLFLSGKDKRQHPFKVVVGIVFDFHFSPGTALDDPRFGIQVVDQPVGQGLAIGFRQFIG